MAARGIALLALAAAAACSELGEVDRGRCGNGVVEPAFGEDCDRDDPSCGAPDTAAACRQLCGFADLPELACPAGASCGRDGVCHVASGQFYVSAETAWTSRQLVVGDTSGDGYPELVGVGDRLFDIRMGGPDGTFVTAVTSPNLAASGEPRALDLNGDTVTDLIVPVGLGLFTLVGDPVSVLQPILQDAFTLPAAGRVIITSVEYAQGAGNDEVPATSLLVALTLPPGQECPLPAGCPVLVLGDGGASLPPGRRVEQLAGERIPWARRPGQSESAVNVALAFRDDPDTALDEDGVFIYQGDAATQTVNLVGELSGLPGAVTRGAWFADLDRDSRGDLIVEHAVAAGGSGISIAWGRSDGTFEPAQLGPALTDPVLAWADLDRDGSSDLVTRSGVVYAACIVRACTFVPGSSQGRGWAGAVTGDFNRDGEPDVAAFRSGGATIDILLGTNARGFWNEASLPSPGVVSTLRAGDFDGNGVDDVAMVAAPFGAVEADQLYVAFGGASQPPGAPTYVGFVGRVLSLDRGQAPLDAQPDTIDDLLVATARGDARSLQIVLGSTSQRMVAPLIPRPRQGSVVAFVDAALPATLDGDGYDDVIALLTDVDGTGDLGGYTLRIYTSDPAGALIERTGPAGFPLDPALFTLGGARWLALPDPVSGSSTVVGIDPFSRAVAVRVSCASSACAVDEPVVLLTGEEAGELTDLHSRDLDGDGDLDVLATFRAVPGRPGAGGVWIWRTGAAGFDPAITLPAPAGVTLLDVTAADLTLDGPATLLLAGRADDVGRIYAAAPLPAGGGWEEPRPDERFDIAAGAANAVELHAGDLDGDGLSDLAVISGSDRTSPRALTVFRHAESFGGPGVVGDRGGDGR